MKAYQKAKRQQMKPPLHKQESGMSVAEPSQQENINPVEAKIVVSKKASNKVKLSSQNTAPIPNKNKRNSGADKAVSQGSKVTTATSNDRPKEVHEELRDQDSDQDDEQDVEAFFPK